MSISTLKNFPVAVLTGFLLINTCAQSPLEVTLKPRLSPLPQDGIIQVYFNNNQSLGSDYIEPYRKINRHGDNLEQIIIDQINLAHYSIDIAIQEFSLPNIAKALVKRHLEGVKIRIILENDYNHSFANYSENEIKNLSDIQRQSYQEFMALVDSNKDSQISEAEINQNETLTILKNAQIPLIDDTEDGSKGSGLMHHKFMIIDEQILLTGSANWSVSSIHGDFSKIESRGNRNDLLVINYPPIAQLFTHEFNLMWGDGVGGKLDSKFGANKPARLPETFNLEATTITVMFSPFSPKQSWGLTTNGLIGDMLSEAEESVDLALYVFSEQRLANILEQVHLEGVEIRALIDPLFAYQYYSEGLDMLGVAIPNKCRYESDNKPWSIPLQSVGTPNLASGDKLHHKFAVIDRKIVITGSHNWSNAANYQNDESLLIIDNPNIAAHYTKEFNTLYQQANLGLPMEVQTNLDQAKKNCPNLLG